MRPECPSYLSVGSAFLHGVLNEVGSVHAGQLNTVQRELDLKCLQGSVQNTSDPGLIALKDLQRIGEVLVSFGLLLLHLLWSFESLAEILSNHWNSYNLPAFCSNVPPLTLSWTVNSFIPGQAWIADAPYYQTANTIVHVGSAHHLLGSIPILQTCQLIFGAVALQSLLWWSEVSTFFGFSCFSYLGWIHAIGRVFSSLAFRKSWTSQADTVTANFCYIWRKGSGNPEEYSTVFF